MTPDADFKVQVQELLPLDAAQVWKLVTSSEGAEHWLGIEGPAPTTPGEKATGPDGTTYELTTIKAGDHIRLLRTDGKTGDESVVQLTLIPDNGGTTLHFHQEGLNDEEHREEMRGHWQRAADKILTIV